MIVVDSDEWRMAKVIPHLERLNIAGKGKTHHYKLELTHKDLQNPDYLIANKVGVERATMNDLVNKIKKRSLEGQLERTMNKGYQPVFLIEGLMPYRSKMSLEAIYGYISKISEGGIVVIHTISAKHTAKHLFKIHKKIEDGSWNILDIPVVRSSSKINTIKKLMGIEGVDEITAKKIKDAFPDIVRFTYACQRQSETGRSKLIKINGIGKKLANKIAGSWVEDWK